jgi:hypothetical protein
MGHVILPSGTTVWVEELIGSINLSNLISDIRCEDYTTSYRISVIGALGKLAENAKPALSTLRDLGSYSGDAENHKLICDAANQAIKKIESGTPSTSSPPPHDNHVSRRSYGPCYNSGVDCTRTNGIKKPQ